jgi:hypothetical protein
VWWTQAAAATMKDANEKLRCMVKGLVGAPAAVLPEDQAEGSQNPPDFVIVPRIMATLSTNIQVWPARPSSLSAFPFRLFPVCICLFPVDV